MADMAKLALTMAEKHGEKLKELSVRAGKGDSVAGELAELSRAFQVSLEMLRRAAS